MNKLIYIVLLAIGFCSDGLKDFGSWSVKGKEAKIHKYSVTFVNSTRVLIKKNRKQRSLNTTRELARVAHILKQEKLPAAEKSCQPWRDAPFDPSAFVAAVQRPWDTDHRQICKLFVQYKENGGIFVCTGVLVGPYHLLTARHCTLDRCLGNFYQITIACGYGKHNEQTDDYANFGSAFASSEFIKYTAYDESATCDSNYGDTRIDLDIVLLKIDRPIGLVLGYYGMTAVKKDILHFLGYPGSFHLNNYISSATDKMMYRLFDNVSTTSSNENILLVRNEIVFGGESGGPWYFIENDNSKYVTAVDSGGASPCREYGAKITNSFIQAYQAVQGKESVYSLSPWEKPDDYCQIIHYQSDIFDFFNHDISLRGVGIDPSIISFDAHVTYYPDQSSSSLFVGITLFNVGNLMGTVTLDYEVDGIVIATTSNVQIPPGDIQRIITSLYISWYGEREIIVHWSAPLCFVHDGSSASVGKVFGFQTTPKPTNHPIQQIQPPTIIPTTIQPITKHTPSYRPTRSERTSTPTLAPTIRETIRERSSTPTLAPTIRETIRERTSTPTLAPTIRETIRERTSTPTLAPISERTSTPTRAPTILSKYPTFKPTNLQHQNIPPDSLDLASQKPTTPEIFSRTFSPTLSATNLTLTNHTLRNTSEVLGDTRSSPVHNDDDDGRVHNTPYSYRRIVLIVALVIPLIVALLLCLLQSSS